MTTIHTNSEPGREEMRPSDPQAELRNQLAGFEERYSISIRWSDVDQAFVTEAPELPGCMAHGASRQEAVANLREAVLLWLDTATETGRREVPMPKWQKRELEIRYRGYGRVKFVFDDQETGKQFATIQSLFQEG